MDWVFNASPSSWDLSEPERDEFDVLAMENNQNIDAFSLDSGKLGDLTMSGSGIGIGTGSGSMKKTRTEQHVSSCLVDGCRANLGNCREYHRRHRVCEAHSKTPVVAIGGKDQRFCQQCSRFHSVKEFDEVKRSCRKRLDGHNRRRRKPTTGVYLNNYYQTFFTNHHQPTTKLLHFGGGGGGGSSPPYTWPTKAKSNLQLHHRPPPPPPPSSSSREIKFPFLLGTDASSSSSMEPKAYNGALSLLSNNTPETNLIAPYLPFTNNNNHLIGMIHFQTQGLELENIFLG